MKPATRVLGVALAAGVRAARPSEVIFLRDAFDAAGFAKSEPQVLIVCYWIEDAFLLILADYWLRTRSQERLPEFRPVCDDTFGGSVTKFLLEALGRKATTLRRHKGAERIADLQQIIRSRASIGIAVDGHGPYGRVGASFCRFAERCSALIIPIAARARFCLTPRLRARIAVPAPRIPVAVAVAAPISVRHGESLSPDAVESGLWAARRSAVELTRAPRLSPE
jgi:hypothetical protein